MLLWTRLITFQQFLLTAARGQGTAASCPLCSGERLNKSGRQRATQRTYVFVQAPPRSKSDRSKVSVKHAPLPTVRGPANARTAPPAPSPGRPTALHAAPAHARRANAAARPGRGHAPRPAAGERHRPGRSAGHAGGTLRARAHPLAPSALAPAPPRLLLPHRRARVRRRTRRARLGQRLRGLRLWGPRWHCALQQQLLALCG